MTEMEDIVERLGKCNPWCDLDWPEVLKEAAAEIASLRSQLEEARRADEWRDISTAPRDGRVVDLWIGGVDGYRATDFSMDKFGRWTREEGYPTTTRVLLTPPTHWRPLPAPPAIQSTDSKVSEQQYDDLSPRYSMKRMRDELALAKKQARKEALEEAAKVADAEALKHNTGSGFDSHPAYSVAHRITAAIRRLSEQSNLTRGTE